MGDITEIFKALEAGDRQAREKLIEVVYEELKTIARTKRGPRDSLNTTALVHEAVLRLGLLENDGIGEIEDRRRFFGRVARAMELILLDRARRRKALKRGGGLDREAYDVALDNSLDTFEQDYRSDFLDLHDALEELGQIRKREHEVVKLRFFCGWTEEEVADCLGVSKSTVQGDFRFARAWLMARLACGD